MAERPLSTADSLAAAKNTPLPEGDNASFHEPRPAFLTAGAETPRDSTYMEPTPNGSRSLLEKGSFGDGAELAAPAPQKAKRRPLLLALLALALLALLVIAIVVPVYFTVIKPKNGTASVSNPGSGTSSHSAPSATSTSKPTPSGAIFGGDGSTVKATNGTTFVYENKLGGICEYILRHDRHLYTRRPCF